MTAQRERLRGPLKREAPIRKAGADGVFSFCACERAFGEGPKAVPHGEDEGLNRMPTINQLIRKGRVKPTYRNTVPALAGLAAEARRLHARLYDHAEEAELGASQGRQGAPDQRLRGDRLHPGRGPQSAGAFGRDDPRRPREGSCRAFAITSCAASSTPRASRTASSAVRNTARNVRSNR